MPTQEEKLFEAFRNYDLEGVKSALNNGARIENYATRRDFDFVVDNPCGNTLFKAIESKTSCEIFKYLFEKGAKISNQTIKGCWSPHDGRYSSLHHLLSENLDLEIIKLFLDNGAEVIPENRNTKKTEGTIGYAISQNSDIQTIQFFLEKDSNTINKTDTHYVKMALQSFNPDLLKFLLKYEFAIDDAPENITVSHHLVGNNWIPTYYGRGLSGERLGEVSNSLGYVMELDYNWFSRIKEEEFLDIKKEIIDILLIHGAIPENLSDKHFKKKEIIQRRNDLFLDEVKTVSETVFEVFQDKKSKLHERGIAQKILDHLFKGKVPSLNDKVAQIIELSYQNVENLIKAKSLKDQKCNPGTKMLTKKVVSVLSSIEKNIENSGDASSEKEQTWREKQEREKMGKEDKYDGVRR